MVLNNASGGTPTAHCEQKLTRSTRTVAHGTRSARARPWARPLSQERDRVSLSLGGVGVTPEPDRRGDARRTNRRAAPRRPTAAAARYVASLGSDFPPPPHRRRRPPPRRRHRRLRFRHHHWPQRRAPGCQSCRLGVAGGCSAVAPPLKLKPVLLKPMLLKPVLLLAARTSRSRCARRSTR